MADSVLPTLATAIPQPKQWSTSALTLAAGKVLDVPLSIEEPSLGQYIFTCVGGGSIEFSLSTAGGDGKSAKSLVSGASGPASRGEGSFRVAEAGVVVARLDNSAASFSAVTLQCVVSLTPISHAIATEAAAMRTAINEQAAHLEQLGKQEEALAAQEVELERQLIALRVSRQVASELRAADGAVAADLDAATDGLAAAYGGGDSSSPPESQLRRAELAMAASKRARVAAHKGRSSIGARAEEAHSAAMRAERRAALAATAARRAADLRPLLPLQEVFAAYAQLATHCCGAAVALRSFPRVDAVFETSRADLFVLECSGFDLRDVRGAELVLSLGGGADFEGVEIASGVRDSFCLLLQGHIVPLIDAAAGSAGGGLDHFPNAADAARAAAALGADVVDFYDEAYDETEGEGGAGGGRGGGAASRAAVAATTNQVSEYLAYSQ